MVNRISRVLSMILSILLDKTKELMGRIGDRIWEQRKENREFKRRYQVWYFRKVLAPIYKIIDKNIVPSYGYEGIDIDSVNKTIEIIEKYQDFVPEKLERLKFKLEEEIFHVSNMDGEVWYIRFDEDGELCKYIIEHYNNLKKEIFMH